MFVGEFLNDFFNFKEVKSKTPRMMIAKVTKIKTVAKSVLNSNLEFVIRVWFRARRFSFPICTKVEISMK